MELVVDRLHIEAGGPLVVVMNRLDAANLGVISSDRVFVRHGDRHAVCILNISEEGNPGVLGVYSEVARFLGVQEGDRVWVEPARRPESLDYIREKINGQRLTPWKIQRIVGDVVEHHL
ncbi:MAG TPA: thymidine phosphorylase, partial [Candidatus Bathyarchaeota archaeon]|nr:thymidine phosphorylase [Candidatus Bathyarchaeota archaeon]